MIKSKRARLAGAYTLTEMLVVLVIIGLLAAIVGPRLFNRLDEAKHRTAELQLRSLATSVDLFRLDVGRIPTREEGLEALVRAPAGAQEWLGPYLSRDAVPLDPWGHAYAYEPDANGAHYRVMSYGSDGRAGGSAAAQDIAFESGQPTPEQASVAQPGAADSAARIPSP